jgi:hypothetical protein
MPAKLPTVFPTPAPTGQRPSRLCEPSEPPYRTPSGRRRSTHDHCTTSHPARSLRSWGRRQRRRPSSQNRPIPAFRLPPAPGHRHQRVVRVRVKIMGSPKRRNVEESQSALIMNDPMLSSIPLSPPAFVCNSRSIQTRSGCDTDVSHGGGTVERKSASAVLGRGTSTCCPRPAQQHARRHPVTRL